MHLRSFRLRLVLLSTILAGGAVIGFSAVAWQLIYNAKVSRLDARMESQLGRLARPLLADGPRSRLDDLRRDLDVDVDVETDSTIAWQVRDAEGRRLNQSSNWPASIEPGQIFPPRSPVLPRFDDERSPRDDPNRRDGFRDRRLRLQARPRLATQRTEQETWRIAAASFPVGQVAIAVSLQTINQEMAAIRTIFLVAIPGTLALVAVGAWVLSRSALRPIQQLTAVMQQVTVTGLDRRVPLGKTDVEFIELIQVFNGMLGRLERSFMQASRFSADAAHELKTPLAILQGELERTLQQAAPGSDLQQRLSSLLDEVRRLSGIVRKLLLLSLADAGQMGLHKVQINLSEQLAVMVEDLELLAPQLAVQTDIAPALTVWGDRDLLTQVLQNLISNAVKYNRPNGWIRITAQPHSTAARITIANASKPMSPEERDRIFDRFYRGDPARTRKVEGIGLGLSLSREIVRAHGGSLAIEPMQGEHTAFTLTLPRPPQSE